MHQPRITSFLYLSFVIIVEALQTPKGRLNYRIAVSNDRDIYSNDQDIVNNDGNIVNNA
jgi:hypothetical protein